MSELHYCEECGRGYEQEPVAQICDEADRAERYIDVISDGQHSHGWLGSMKISKLREAIRSLAVTGPREYAEVEAPWSSKRYRIVLPERLVEILTVEGKRPLNDGILAGAILSGFDAGREYERERAESGDLGWDLSDCHDFGADPIISEQELRERGGK